MDDGQIAAALDAMFPVAEDATDRQKRTAAANKDSIMICMLRPDLAQFVNTKWGFINAVADHVDHADPIRHTKNYAENRWASIIGGHPILDMAVTLTA